MSDNILGRIGNLVRANVNALIDGAEDPQKMLDQLVRDYTNNIAEAEQAVAQTIGNLRLAEDDARTAQAGIAEWGGKAARRVEEGRRAPRRRQHGRRRQVRQPGQGRAQAPDQLRGPGQDLRDADRLSRRARRPAQGRPQPDARQARRAGPEARRARRPGQDGRGPGAGPGVAEERQRHGSHQRGLALSRRRSAATRHRCAGWQEVAASSLDAQFDSLEDASTDADVDARLAALKGGGTPAS